MTDHDLRALLAERVADETGPDLAGAAWAVGRRRIRRRTTAVVGGACAAVLVIAGGVALGARADGPMSRPASPATSASSPEPPTPEPTIGVFPSVGLTSQAGSPYQGLDTWWFRDSKAEAGLPYLDDSGLPRTIDLTDPPHPDYGILPGPSIGLLGVWPDGPLSRVVAVTADGASVGIDIARLAPVADEQGNQISSLLDESLAPDGTRAFFVQERSLEVFDLVDGGWTSLEAPDHVAEGARWITSTEIWVPRALDSTGEGTMYDLVTGGQRTAFVRLLGDPEWRGAEGYGPVVAGQVSEAQAVFLTGNATGPDETSYGGIDAVAASVRGRTQLLVMDPKGGLWKGCCPVVGWEGDTVLFESRSADARVLAWDVGTERVRQVSRIVGWTPGEESYVASWRVPLS